jgi:hypothetical protein
VSEHESWAVHDSYAGWVCRECGQAEGWSLLDGYTHGNGCLTQMLASAQRRAARPEPKGEK